MGLEILLIAVLPGLLVAAAIWDLTSFTIPNTFILGMLALFVIFAAAGIGEDLALVTALAIELGQHRRPEQLP